MVCLVTRGCGLSAMSSVYFATVSTMSPTPPLQIGHFLTVYVYSCVIALSGGVGRWYAGAPGFLPRGLASPVFFPGLYRYERSSFLWDSLSTSFASSSLMFRSFSFSCSVNSFTVERNPTMLFFSRVTLILSLISVLKYPLMYTLILSKKRGSVWVLWG